MSGTVSTRQYASTSAQSAAFATLNSYRTQCGFPALQGNTILNHEAQNHAKYECLTGVLSDDEVSGNPGFTGVT
ncbi:hypothetical protein [Burkholderia stagnalis]|uniref:Uncharacterized protein n=1 Tax=Burkholderia stagnalis TaxID=1503054 RepID=A0ABX9YEK2_9BURK|nr:hypothetical protein [Burkholderia stagnalis]RQQ47590.1 hypothetical protein DF158_33640 [Burkholderia stagnalis]RQQ59319.1 hypothetical protein DF137_33800 [Burkholderia stagnalis]RQQ59797.1 hypothetical protein DF139_33680 [Burkholderia stagnalis]RQQ74140.1 hypothetical protein DF138_33185 [Burkholderia stagnalis]RQQ79882.1 hypothetical protein DF134_33945 [Burkholderia stagnalis]